MSVANPPSASLVSRGEKILLEMTWLFVSGGAILAIGVTAVTFKHRETQPLNAGILGLLLFAFAFPAVHFAGYFWSRIFACVAGLLHLGWSMLLAFAAWMFLVSRSEHLLSGFFLGWAVFHLTLAVLMFRLRFRRGPPTPRQAARAVLADMAKTEAARQRPTWHWRGYAIHSTFHNEIAESAGKWPRWPVLRPLGWTIGWVLYLGGMGATFALSLMPSVLLGSWFGLGPPSAAYWILAALAFLGSALLFGFAGWAVLRHWRQRRVDLASLAFLAGAAFGLLGAAVLLPQGTARFFAA
jgi:hypothetical protein